MDIHLAHSCDALDTDPTIIRTIPFNLHMEEVAQRVDGPHWHGHCPEQRMGEVHDQGRAKVRGSLEGDAHSRPDPQAAGTREEAPLCAA